MEIENNIQKWRLFNGFAVETCFTLIMAASNLISGFGEVYFIIHSLANGLSKSWILNNIEIFSAAGYILAGSVMDFFGRKIFITLVSVSFIVPWLIITFPQNIYLLLLALSMHQTAAGNTVLIWQKLYKKSPIWLYSRGKYQESIDVLTKLRHPNEDLVKVELDEIKEFCGGTPRINLNLRELGKECLNAWKNFIFVAILVILLGGSGYTILFEYAEELIGNDENQSIDTIIIFALYMLGGLNGMLVAPYLVRFINVNVVLSIASFGMGRCVLIFNVFRDLTWIFGGVYFILGVSGTVPMLPILTAEIFPQKVNGISNGLIGSFNYLFAWLLYKLLRDPEKKNH